MYYVTDIYTICNITIDIYAIGNITIDIFTICTIAIDVRRRWLSSGTCYTSTLLPLLARPLDFLCHERERERKRERKRKREREREREKERKREREREREREPSRKAAALRGAVCARTFKWDPWQPGSLDLRYHTCKLFPVSRCGGFGRARCERSLW